MPACGLVPRTILISICSLSDCIIDRGENVNFTSNKKAILTIFVFCILYIVLYKIKTSLPYTLQESTSYAVYQTNTSSNNKYTIQSRITSEGGELVLISIDSSECLLKTNNIIYTPMVNDTGKYCYLEIKGSDSTCSDVFFMKEKIYSGEACRIINIDEDAVFFSESVPSEDVSRIWKYSIDESILQIVCRFSDGYIIDGIKYQNNILIDFFDKETHKSVVKVFEENNEGNFCISKEYLQYGSDTRLFEKNGNAYIDTITGNNNGKYLYAALYEYYMYQYGEPFSLGNNFAGRLSWNESYRLNGLIELYMKTGLDELKEMVCYAVTNILNLNNEKIACQSEETISFLWATKDYSINGDTFQNLLVDDAMIIYPLLKAVNYNILESQEDKKEILYIANRMFEYYERNYSDGHYKFEKGCSFWADGVILPWNQQNIFGLVCLELYKATGNVIFYNRCKELMLSFKSDWIRLEDESIIWHYWPNEFYDGWEKDDNISLNTPERQRTEDYLFEDTSHAGFNTLYVLEYYKMFDDGVIVSQDIQGIQSSMNRWTGYDNGFSRFISGDVEYLNASYLWIPSPVWASFGNEKFDNYYTSIIDYVYPDFDLIFPLWAYAIEYDNENPIELNIIRIEYSSGEEQTMKIESVEDVIKYYDWIVSAQ